MFLPNKKIFLFFLPAILASFFIFNWQAQAQDDGECALDKIEHAEKTLPKESFQALLEKCKLYYEEKSALLENDIKKTTTEKKTLSNEIASLQSKIKNLDYKISQSNLMVKDLSSQIKSTEHSINETNGKILTTQEKLALTLQLRYEEDHKSIVEILLGERSLSAFFDNLVALENLNMSIQGLLGEIKGLKTNLETQKIAMDSEKKALESVVVMQSLQKNESEKSKKEKDNLLKMTEAEYQKQLKAKSEIEKRANEIRTRIFQLAGDIKAPTFGEALDIAKSIEKITNVRPAFLLAVLTQESNIGKNVGQCYLKDTQTGAGVNIKSGLDVKNVMKPMGLSGRKGDISDFLSITNELGRDPFQTPVSCPIPSVGGYGGAMGPAQFIPTTWALYRDKVKEITKKPADPWNIYDSFLAAALYLGDYGAKKRNYDDEWKAAMIYFAGTVNTAYRFYGDNVIVITKKYEQDIADIEKSKQ